MAFQKGNKIWMISPQVRCTTCGVYLGKTRHICHIKIRIKRNCLNCNKSFLTIPADIKRGHGKYCSIKCRQLSKTGIPVFINGKAKKSSNWKGNKVSYKGLHKWISNNLGKPNICKHCGKLETRGKFIHWANISGLYLRNFNDWVRLCAKCHKKYDEPNIKNQRRTNYLAGLAAPK